MRGTAGDVVFHRGLWWRATAYELRDDPTVPTPPAHKGQRVQVQRAQVIVPARGARLERYEIQDKIAHTGRTPAYLALANLADRPDDEILAWVREYGLLGLLPRQLVTVAFPPHRIGKGMRQRFLWRSGPAWRSTRTWPMEGPCAVLDQSSLPFARVPLWNLRRYFPGVPRARLDAGTVLDPTTAEFWKVYGEPVVEIRAAAHQLRQASNVKEPGVVLGALVSDAAPWPFWEHPRERPRLAWSAHSLFGHLALWALEDTCLQDDMIRSCGVCGRLFYATRTWTDYCSPRCKDTAKKRRRRAKQK